MDEAKRNITYPSNHPGVRKDKESGKRWLLNWGLRHGQVALEVLERATQKEGGR